MSLLNLKNFHIESLVSVSPKRIIDFTSDKTSDKVKRLARNIGIEKKFVCEKGQFFSDLAKAGIFETLNKLKLTTDDVDSIILVTQSSDYIIPGTAVLLQDRCGFSNDVLAFDINLGCSGMPYGFSVAHGQLLSGAKRVLVLGGDQSFSQGTTDEGHSVLFGDGVSVASVVLKDRDSNCFFTAGTDGSGYKSLYIPDGGKRRPVNKKSLEPRMDETGVMRTGTDVILDGPKILSFSVARAQKEILRIMSAAKWDFEGLDYCFLHQANKMINETIRRKLKVPIEKFPNSLKYYGNTSVASATLTMTSIEDAHWNKDKAKSILCTFGIGLSWSSLSYLADGTEISGHIHSGLDD